jgi:predicted enzyme related to lactoylglutathione lyase
MELLANIDVDDVSVATDFYCRAFDLTIGRRFGNSGIELLGASCAIYLLEKPAGSVACNAPGSSRTYARHWTPVHLDFVVPDINPACERARAAGATPEGPMRTQPWGHIAMFADPFGHGFCLIQFLNRGYDEIAS